MKKRILSELIDLARVPDTDRRTWLNGARDSANYLAKNFKSDEVLLYASGPHFHAQTVLVELAKVTPPDREDLDGSQISSDDTWFIERVYGGGEGHRIYLDPPMSHPFCQSLVDSEKLVFVRSMAGVDQPKLPIELNQKLVHALSLHYLEERDAFCRLDERGDIEDVIKIYRNVVGDHFKDLHAVSITGPDLAKYMAVTGQALFCRFDATRFVPSRFESWDGAEEQLHDVPDMRFRSRVVTDHASFANGWIILRTNLTVEKMVEDWKDEQNQEKQYATFIIYDRKNKAVIETSCGPGHIVSYFEKDSDLPWEVSPAFFRPEVLQKYKSDPEKYHIEDRSISCRNSWYLKTYDINEAGQVHTYACYLADLPYEEQLYWKSFNEKPKANISQRAFQTDILGQFSDTDDPLFDVKESVRQLDEKAPFWWKRRGKELMESVLYPATDSVSEWGKEIIALDQMVVEGFRGRELRKIADANKGVYQKEWGSLKLLEVCLVSLGWNEAEAVKTVAPLRELHRLRNPVGAHGSPREKAEIVRRARTDYDTLRNHFSDLSTRVHEALETTSKALPVELNK
ncbi:hypothetical protein [uncultured Tateyamaria sp.]|uniref:hypothetical protein n=1 Tax=uncultured Tateyamaria sp. TaxID=455651 RepID=UPI00262084EC|nr:hypothetical protein [uncultured Tateyamaria sp.]